MRAICITGHRRRQGSGGDVANPSASMGYDEIFGTAFGLLSVVLTVRQSVWCWPTGIVNVAFFALMFFRTRLYADAGLQVLFLAISVYGWYEWTHPGKERQELPVTRTPRRQAGLLAVLTAAGAAALGSLLYGHTDAAVPFWNSATTAMSLAAQWMMARKLLENWLVWIAVDVVSIGVYLSQGLHLTALLYGVYLVLAVSGYREWRRSSKHAPPA